MTRRPTQPPTRLLAGVALLVAASLVRRALLPANVRIADPAGPPTIDRLGRAHSIQAATLEIGPAAVEALWSPTGLDRLGRTYWRFLTRTTLGLLRVVATPDSLLLVLLARPLVLLAFGRPDYLLTADRGLICWPIRGGLLAAPRQSAADNGPPAAGLMRIEIRRAYPTDVDPVNVQLEFSVVDFPSSVARLLGPAFYAATQARLHVIVTHTFMRSLAHMRLAPPDR